MQIRTLVLLSFSLMASTDLRADWPQWRGPHRDGVASPSPPLIEELPPVGLQPLWKNSVDFAKGKNGGWSSPVVSNDRVLVFSHNRIEGSKTDREEFLICLDVATGKLVWENVVTSRKTQFNQSGTPAVANDRVYVLGAGRVARAIDAASGKTLWTRELPGPDDDTAWQASFAVQGGVAVVFAGRLFGINAETGEILWQGEDSAKEGVHGSPAIAKVGSTTLAISPIGKGELLAVELKTGKEAWRVKAESNSSTPVIRNDLMLTLGQSRKGGLRCHRISAEKSDLLWQHQKINDAGASPVIVGEYVFAQGERKLVCVSLASGEEQWSTELDMKQPRYTSLVASGDQVFYTFEDLFVFKAQPDAFQLLYRGLCERDGLVATEDAHRKLLGLDELSTTSEGQKEAEKLWRNKIGGAGPIACASPAISDGRLYVRLKSGLACYDLRRQK